MNCPRWGLSVITWLTWLSRGDADRVGRALPELLSPGGGERDALSLLIARGQEVASAAQERFSCLLACARRAEVTLPDHTTSVRTPPSALVGCELSDGTDAYVAWTAWVDRPLLKDELRRQRFHDSAPSPSWAPGGPRWGRAFSVFVRVAPAGAVDHLARICSGCRLNMVLFDDLVAELLSELGRIAKKFGSSFSPFWEWFVNLEQFGGFKVVGDEFKLLADVRQWLSEPEVSFRGWPSWFDDFAEGCQSFVSNWVDPGPAPTLEEYTDSLLWARAGSSTDGTLWVEDVDGKRLRLPRTKAAASIALSPAYVRQLIVTPGQQRAVAIPKREGGKVRMVVNSDLPLFLKMDWLSWRIERGFRGCPLSPLFLNGGSLSRFWDTFFLEGRDPSTVKFPLDQSKFDHAPGPLMFERVFDALASIPLDSTATAVFQDVRRTVLEGGFVHVGDKRLPIVKGVVSGWRWTAFLDTLINFAECFAISKYVGRISPRTWFDGQFQGDDIRLRCGSEVDAALLSEGYRLCGLDVNNSKTFVSRTRDEFLRNVVFPDGVRGYPARCLLSILWRNPVSPEPGVGVVRLTEGVTRWHTLANRGGRPSVCRRLCGIDISRGNGLPGAACHAWVRTPVHAGGGGWSLPGDDRAKLPFLSGADSGIDFPRVRVIAPSGVLPGIQALRSHGVDASTSDIDSFAGRLAGRGFFARSRAIFSPAAPVVEWSPRTDGNSLSSSRGLFVRGAWPSWLLEGYFDRLITNGKDPPSHMLTNAEDWKVVKRHASRGVARAWILGQLRLPVPRRAGWSIAYLGGRFGRLGDRLVRCALAQGRFSFRHWAGLTLHFHRRIDDELEKIGYRIGL